MILKNFEVENIYNILQQDIVDAQEIKDIKVKFRIAKILRVLSSPLEDFQKTRNELIQEHAEKDEEGNMIRPTDKEGKPIEDQVRISNQKEFNKKLIVLSQEDNELELGTSLSIDDLANSEIDLDVYKLSVLEKLLDSE
jgi:hypothetical protein